MEISHAVLLTVAEEPGRVLVGRTLLQKKLYFAAVLLDQRDAFGFRPHYYGPYSQQVADATGSLVSNRFLEEQVEIFPDDNVFGERRRHSYKITDDGQQLLDSLEKEEEIKKWRDVLQRINSQALAGDFNLLSVAAKVITILSEVEKATPEEMRHRATEYGWDLKNDQIRSVEEFLTQLGLVVKAK